MSDEPDGQTFCHRCERVHRYCECDEFAHLGTHSMHWGRAEFIAKGAASRPHPMGE